MGADRAAGGDRGRVDRDTAGVGVPGELELLDRREEGLVGALVGRQGELEVVEPERAAPVADDLVRELVDLYLVLADLTLQGLQIGRELRVVDLLDIGDKRGGN